MYSMLTHGSNCWRWARSSQTSGQMSWPGQDSVSCDLTAARAGGQTAPWLCRSRFACWVQQALGHQSVKMQVLTWPELHRGVGRLCQLATHTPLGKPHHEWHILYLKCKCNAYVKERRRLSLYLNLHTFALTRVVFTTWAFSHRHLQLSRGHSGCLDVRSETNSWLLNSAWFSPSSDTVLQQRRDNTDRIAYTSYLVSQLVRLLS